MKKIPLSNSEEFALVDDSDYEIVSSYGWSRHKNGHAHGWRRINGKKEIFVKMHRLIMRFPKGKMVDHKDHNRLNNQRENLRVVNQSQNSQNMILETNRKGKKSRFKGVMWHRFSKSWGARITKDYKCISLRYHKTEEAAARAYNEAAKKYFGEFAYLNPV